MTSSVGWAWSFPSVQVIKDNYFERDEPPKALYYHDGKGNVLLQLRKDDKTWATHGGSIELDERVEDAMIRELKEEIGLTVLEYKLLNIYSGPEHHNIYPNGDEVSCIDIVYYSHSFEGEIKIQEDEVLDIKWFNKDNLPDNIGKNTRKWLKDYFKLLNL